VKERDDIEEKWVVAPADISFTKEEIKEQVRFQGQYFES
jgi:inorganic pyrophosphatase